MKHSIRLFLILFISAISEVYTLSAEWPISESNRKGMMSLYGDFRAGDVGAASHSGLDITQSIPNDSLDSCIVPVLCSTNSFFSCYLAKCSGNRADYIHGILLIDPLDGNYILYQHVKGIDPLHIERLIEQDPLETLRVGERIGYVGEKGEPPDVYGNSSAHLHFGIISGNPICSMKYFPKSGTDIRVLTDPTELYPVENPLNKLTYVSDNNAPIFMNSEASGTPIDIVPNLVNYASFKPIYLNGYVNNNACPWAVFGKVDIIARINDYMDVVGEWEQQSISIVPGIYELKYEILSGGTPISEIWLIKEDHVNSSFSELLPGGTIFRDRHKLGTIIRPFKDGFAYYPGYNHLKYSHNYWVVSNTLNEQIDAAGCWDTAGSEEGFYNIRVTAYDHAGNSSSVEIEVEVKHADLFVDCSSKHGTENGSAEYPYRTLTDGVQSASAGDTIFVAPGTYSDNEAFPIIINKNGITIEGAGYENSIVEGNQNGSIFVITGYDVTISDLTVTCTSYVVEPDFGAIVVDNGMGTIKNCRISENDCPGICLFWSEVETLVSNCVIEGNTPYGIYSDHAHYPANIVNCTIINNGTAGIAPKYDSFAHVSNCNIVNHSFAGICAYTSS